MRTKQTKALILFLPLSLLLFFLLAIWTRAAAERRGNCIPLATELTPSGKEGVIAYSASTAVFTDENFPALWITVTNGAWELLLDGDVIASYGMDRQAKGAFSSASSRFVSLPDNAKGAKLQVNLYGRYAQIGTLLYGDYETLFKVRVQEGLPALLTASFMFLFGVIFLFLTSTFAIRATDTGSHVVGAVVSMVTGLWLITAYDQAFLVLTGDYTGFLAQASYLLLLPLLSLMLAFLYGHRKTLAWASGIFFTGWVVVIVLHLTNILDMYRLNAAFDVLFLLAMIAVPVFYYRQRVDMYVEPSVEMQERGILLYVFCLMIYVISRVTVRYEGAFISLIGMQMPIFGAVAFVVAQVLNYYLNIGESYTRRQQYAELNQLAYVDLMTGLPNRKSAQNVFRMLNSTPDNYCIVSLDLNGLKQVNDNYGHKAGDLLLQTTAATLNEDYSKNGFHARLGGDEFVVVLNKTDPAGAEKLLEKTNAKLAEFGQRQFKTACGISYGYAFRNECPDGDSTAVFALADERMYTQKKAYHKKRLMEI